MFLAIFSACKCYTNDALFFHRLVVAGPRRYRVSPNPPPSAAPLVWQDPTELHPRLNANVAWRVNHGFPTTTTGKYENQITLKKYIKNKHHKKKTHTHTKTGDLRSKAAKCVLSIKIARCTASKSAHDRIQ